MNDLPLPELPRLGAPLGVAWESETGLQGTILPPVCGAEVVVLCAGEQLLAFRLGDGKALWRRELPARAVSITSTELGFVVAHDGDDGDVIRAFDWSGDELWCSEDHWSLARKCVRGVGRLLLAAGTPLQSSSSKVCKVLESRSGRLLDELPCPGDLPDLTGHGLVSSVYSPRDLSQGGLFLCSSGASRCERLIEPSHSVRLTLGPMVVVDTFDGRQRSSQLIAYDLQTKRVAWTAPGGPNLCLSGGFEVLAAVESMEDRAVVVVLRELRSGRWLWRAAPIDCRRWALTTLTTDLLLAHIDLRRTFVYHRESGVLLQELELASSLSSGPLLTGSGVVDVHRSTVRLITGAAEQ